MTLLPEAEIERALQDDLSYWRLEDGGQAISREVEAPTFLDGIGLVQRVAQAAEEADHHPDIDIRYTRVTFKLSTHSAGGLTAKDLDLAGRIDALAGELPGS